MTKTFLSKVFYLTVCTVVFTVALFGLGAGKVEAQTIQEDIAQAALAFPEGEIVGQCKEFVRQVIRNATGMNIGSGYYTAYLQMGYEISESQADRGDIIQLTDPKSRDLGNDNDKLHSAIILSRQPGGVFEVIHSNWGGTEQVSIDDYNPVQNSKARGAELHFFRIDKLDHTLPTVAVPTIPEASTPTVQPGQPAVSYDYKYFTWAGIYVIRTCNTGRMKVFLDDELIFYTSSDDGPSPSLSKTKFLWPRNTAIKPYVLKVEYWDFPSGSFPQIEHSAYFPGLGYACAATGNIPFLEPDPSEPTPSLGISDSAMFDKDITVQDGTHVASGQSFIKSWGLVNTGSTTWSNYKLKFVSGSKMGGASEVAIPATVAPWAYLNATVNLTAPTQPGTYRGYWQMANSVGVTFGDLLWVEVVVDPVVSPINVNNERLKLFGSANYANFLEGYGIEETNSPNANSYSMEIPGGWSVVTYRNDNYSGESRCWYESVGNLQDHSWHNAIQSIKVFNYNHCTGGQKVKLYKYANMDHLLYELEPTSTGTNAPDKDTYSMEIPTGWSVRTWDEDNTVGRSRCWSESVNNLQDHESWHLDIASMRIYTSNECGTGGVSFAKLCKQTGAHAGADCTTVTEDIPSLGANGFGNDAVKSVWMQGPWEIMLFEHDNYDGQRYKYRDSNNDIRNYPPLENYQGYGTSSVKVRLYDQGITTFYREGDFNDGDPFKTDNTLDNFGHWDYDNQPKSAKVKSGYEAIICSDANFHGICGRLSGDNQTLGADLNNVAQGLRANVSSVRLCEGTCDPAPDSPIIVTPGTASSLLPGTINFVWSGNANEYQVEVWGGALATIQKLNWSSQTNWSLNLAASTQPYSWRVRGWNEFGEGEWTATQTIFVQDIAPTQVQIAGPVEVESNTEYTFEAFVNPQDADNLSYVWSPTPDSGQGSATASYEFASVGVHAINLTVSNAFGSVNTELEIEVADEPSECVNEFCAEYFDNTSLQGTPAYTTIEEEIDHDWGGYGPGNGIGNDYFSVRWEGSFYFEAGDYEFGTVSDDGVRLWIDEQLIIDNWEDHGFEIDLATTALTSGYHEIKLEYHEEGGGAIISLWWDSIVLPDGCVGEDEYCVRYYDNMNLSGDPVVEKIDDAIDQDWGGGGPTNLPVDYFSAVWQGNFDFEDGNYEFSYGSDDGMRMWVNEELVIDNWYDQGYVEDEVTYAMSAGRHLIKVEYYEKTGGAAVTLDWQHIDEPCIGEEEFCAEYFDNTSLQGAPVYTTIEEEIDHDWGGFGPGNGIGDNYFSVRWEGNFYFEAGEYEFWTASDDGVRVWVDGQIVIDNWQDHGYEEDLQELILTEGQHHIKLEYHEEGGGAVVALDWWSI